MTSSQRTSLQKGWKVLRRDPEATAKAEFNDPRSYISFDGHQYLFGLDATLMRDKICERDKAKCHYCGVSVGWAYGELHHLVGGRGRQRTWDDDNLVWACGPCHRKQHVQIGGRHANRATSNLG